MINDAEQIIFLSAKLENMKKYLQNRRKANLRGSSHAKMKQITDSTAESYYCLKTNG